MKCVNMRAAIITASVHGEGEVISSGNTWGRPGFAARLSTGTSRFPYPRYPENILIQ